jgi:hypothetical protein
VILPDVNTEIYAFYLEWAFWECFVGRNEDQPHILPAMFFLLNLLTWQRSKIRSRHRFFSPQKIFFSSYSKMCIFVNVCSPVGFLLIIFVILVRSFWFQFPHGDLTQIHFIIFVRNIGWKFHKRHIQLRSKPFYTKATNSWFSVGLFC